MKPSNGFGRTMDTTASVFKNNTLREKTFFAFKFQPASIPTKFRMKLLVFAQVPPPPLGQAFGVQRLLAGLGGDFRKKKRPYEPPNRFGIECYHVDARLSRDLQDLGKFRAWKFFKLFGFCLQAIWCRFRYGVTNFYYIPAPGKRATLYRDWIVLLLCRPFFRKTIFHWHAAGLAEWLETSAYLRTRNFTYRLMKNADLSIVQSAFNRRDAETFSARRVAVIPTGVPDPCPEFDQGILSRRRTRARALKKILSDGSTPANKADAVIGVLYLSHCMREKGVFDTVEGVALANEKLAAKKSTLRFKLTVIGPFISSAEEKEMQELIHRRDLQDVVECPGFVSEERKAQAYADADLFCFPTYYHAESFGAVIVEAMAFGLPIVTTRWRSIPEILPQGYPGFVDPKSPGQIAEALQCLAGMDLAGSLREMFIRRFTLERHFANLAEAIHSVEKP